MQKRTPKITISKKQKQLGDILKNASKSRCEPEIPYHKLWPLIRIADLQLKTKNPKNSKPSPQLQPPFAIEDLGLQPRAAHALFYRKQTSFHCKPKPLIANPPLQLRIWSLQLRISHVFSAANHKKLHCKPTSLIASQNLNCNPPFAIKDLKPKDRMFLLRPTTKNCITSRNP